jgi:hypothetical protein
MYWFNGALLAKIISVEEKCMSNFLLQDASPALLDRE